ncbi:dihydrofolate reductase family protein [Lentzea sp. HUAS12]|uniref:dihydrofolate reductase family protein n=1 Tax=Lentzea sp. HUAS12 TaxID=2951806 RepID=UPI0020A051D3|nr:deaminase [Lentzea sp. HUAS12]USX54298.1 deaminase [Lentzea sp. HUAS12]
MRSISATMFVTLDGVVQGFGRPDEDTRGGFPHGGWGAAYGDEVLGAETGNGMAQGGAMLFGRRTWQDFLGVWACADDGNPFTAHMNAARKYVVSGSLTSTDARENSELLRSLDDVGALAGDLSVAGGAALLGGPAPRTEFDLTGTVTTPKGVVVAHYTRVSPGAR